MNALVVYDTMYGNTERIARAIAGRLGGARLIKAEEAETLAGQPCDLLIVGGPTERHAVSPAMRALLDDLPRGACQGTRAAAFDTRYRMSALLAGSAASWIAGRLKRAGASLVLPPEKFFIERDVPPQGEKAPPRAGAPGTRRGAARRRVGRDHSCPFGTDARAYGSGVSAPASPWSGTTSRSLHNVQRSSATPYDIRKSTVLFLLCVGVMGR